MTICYVTLRVLDTCWLGHGPEACLGVLRELRALSQDFKPYLNHSRGV